MAMVIPNDQTAPQWAPPWTPPAPDPVWPTISGTSTNIGFVSPANEVDPEYIDKLAEIMRKRGISAIRVNGVEIFLGPDPSEPPERDPFQFRDPPEVQAGVPGSPYRFKRTR
jgi:hypothetical protein